MAREQHHLPAFGSTGKSAQQRTVARHGYFAVCQAMAVSRMQLSRPVFISCHAQCAVCTWLCLPLAQGLGSRVVTCGAVRWGCFLCFCLGSTYTAVNARAAIPGWCCHYQAGGCLAVGTEIGLVGRRRFQGRRNVFAVLSSVWGEAYCEAYCAYLTRYQVSEACWGWLAPKPIPSCVGIVVAPRTRQHPLWGVSLLSQLSLGNCKRLAQWLLNRRTVRAANSLWSHSCVTAHAASLSV